ncbi:hypothetical protein ACF09H_09065 [Streptomyces sp. NPDC014983]|uniref:hypothetical protein n=1 Tax=Streptomyces sp. NPDC014983 TaxID=3364933 RepID=UPI003700475C
MKDSTKHTLRTIVPTALGIAAVLPAVVGVAGIPKALPRVAAALAIAADATRAVALPAVQALLPGWLRTDTWARE